MTQSNFSLGMPQPPLTRVSEFDPEDEYRPEPEPEPLPPSWLDGSVRIGIHASIAGGPRNALETARTLGCNALQIFSLTWRRRSRCCVCARFRRSMTNWCAVWRWARIFWWCIQEREARRRV